MMNQTSRIPLIVGAIALLLGVVKRPVVALPGDGVGLSLTGKLELSQQGLRWMQPEVVWPGWAEQRRLVPNFFHRGCFCHGGFGQGMEPAVTFGPWFEEGGLKVLAAASVGAVAVEVWRMERGVPWGHLEQSAWRGFVHRETAIAGSVVWREGDELRRAFEASVAIALAGEDPVQEDWWPQKERRLADVIAWFGFRPDVVLTWRGEGSPVRLECDLEARRVLMVTPERWGVFFLDDDAWAAVRALAVQVPEGGVPQVALVAGE